jgi:hypothetical protein
VDHKIELEEKATPGYCPLYKMSMEQLEAAKTYIYENLHKGFIVPSNAPFASPILMAKKADGGLRFCVDFRKLNSVTKKDLYPLPLIDEMMQRVRGAKYFTKLDIRQGFHRIRMDPDSEDLTTFRSRYGSYKYKVMPFGVTNGPASFQRFMNSVLTGILDVFVTAFVDDILIYSETLEEHEKHVKEVLKRLREAGLQVSLSKCEFHKKETKFLGFIIGVDGIRVDPGKIRVIQEWEPPDTVRGIQSFLGFCNFYRRFIEEYSKIAKPLFALTKKGVPWSWTEKCQGAFEELKKKLTKAPVLAHYDPHAQTRVETDASDEALGGVLSQRINEDEPWHPVAYFSKTMDKAEKAYEIYDKELLAIIRAFQEWEAELIGLRRTEAIEVLTDHEALQWFQEKRRLNSRQIRWSLILQDYRFKIQYRSGKKNVLADVLSRKDISQKGQREEFVLLPKQYWEPKCLIAPVTVNEELNLIDRIKQANRTHESLEEFRQEALGEQDSKWTLEEGLLLHEGRMMVPEDGDLRARLLDEIHRQPSVAHPGMDKTSRLLSVRYYWPG